MMPLGIVLDFCEMEILENSFNSLKVGDRVTNARGWDGVIKRIDTQTWPNPYYWVYWKERENHTDKEVAKHPICGHTFEQIWRIANDR